MIRAAVKSVLANTVYYSGLLSAIERYRSRSTPSGSCIILMYHRVLPQDRGVNGRPDWERYQSLPGIVVSPEMFEAQMRFLARDYQVISTNELLKTLDSGKLLLPRSVVLTFDDGWRDNYVYAFPVLKKLNLPATIFLATGFINTNRIFWPERVIDYLTSGDRSASELLAGADTPIPPAIGKLIEAAGEVGPAAQLHLLDRLVAEMKLMAPDARDILMKSLFSDATEKDPARSEVRVMLDWQEIAEMFSAGITFGSHGVSHELLTMVDSGQQERELRESREVIEKRIGGTVDIFAYPNGNHDDQIKRLVRRAGYRCAMAVTKAHVSHQSDRYSLGRTNIHQGNSLGFSGRFSVALFAFHLQRVMD